MRKANPYCLCCGAELTAPSKEQLDQARQKMIDTFVEAEKAQRAYISLIERARFDVDRKTTFLLREQMQQTPKGE